MLPRISLRSIQTTILVMPALVAGIHIFYVRIEQRRGWPEQVRP
jgi:hypothetical protein